MKNSLWCHLHQHTTYSTLDGLGSIDSIVQRHKELGFAYVAITDHGNVDGAIKFQRSCEKFGIKGIIGAELYITKDATIKDKSAKTYHVTVLVKNEIGWRNLLMMLSYANLIGFHHRPRIGMKTLLKHHDGLIIMSACFQTFIFADWGIDLLQHLLELKDYEDIYFEIMPHNYDQTKKTNEELLRISKKFDIPLVATNDNHYIFHEDNKAQEVLLAIQRNVKWNDPNRWRFSVTGLHIRSSEEMMASFKEQGVLSEDVYRMAMRKTLEVAAICKDFVIEKKTIRLPLVRNIAEEDEEATLRSLCIAGFVDKIGEFMPWEYEERFEYEFNILKSKNFIRYFLIVYDLVKWCRENDILVSSRGSVGCSLIAYMLSLTEIDPIKYGLPFSRFINEERIDYPDIDLDLADNKRDLVRDRLHELYGENNVAGISTFNRMKARGVVRDVSRVFDIPLKEVDLFCKSIDNSITDALEIYPDFYPEVIKYSLKLENGIKSLGRHAAGKVISNKDLRDGNHAHLVLKEGEIAVNWDGEDCEYQGLMKLDILGLNTLTVISEAIKLIRRNHNVDIDYFSIPLDDQAIYQSLSNGNFSGIFQMGWAVRNLIAEMGVSNIQEWSDAIALARPGPMDSGMAAEYIRCKHGGQWERKHPVYEEVLEKTYGQIVYQEEVMGIFHKVAGLPYSTADHIRKIIGKKRDPKEFEPFKKMFIQGCLKNNTLDYDEAEEFWHGLLKHARYSFNMAHSLSYAILGYKCLYLLHYYPVEFICATLSYGTDKTKEDMLNEARKLNIPIIPPKFGISHPKEWVIKNGKLYLPYVEIRGIGDKLAEEICVKKKITKRKGFFSTGETCVELKPNVRAILEKIGAFSDEEALPEGAEVYFDIDLGQYVGHDNIGIEEREPYPYNEELMSCCDCPLHKECDSPVAASSSGYNLMIIGEAPGKDESKEGEPFVGKAGQRLWKELRKYGYRRRYFHVSNVCKCWPSKSKNPTEVHIDACAKWLDDEIEWIKPSVILALGNASVYRFKGEMKGITRLSNSGIAEWNSRYNCWIIYCMHPSAVLRNPSNEPSFIKGINTFIEKIESLS